MHDDETTRAYAPFWSFPRGLRHENNAHLLMGGAAAISENSSASGTTVNSDGMDDVGRDDVNTVSLGGADTDTDGDMDVSLADEVGLVSEDMDGILEDFLTLVSEGGGDIHDGLSLAGGGDHIGEEDLAWLEEDTHPPRTAVVAPPVCPAASAGHGLASTIHEIEPFPYHPMAAMSGCDLATTWAAVGEVAGGSESDDQDGAGAVAGGAEAGASLAGEENGSNQAEAPAGWSDETRRLAVARYLEKKKRRRWLKTSSYQSRQRVANSRPRHKGRFLPLESEFVPVAELQKRKRALMKRMQEGAAAALAQEEEVGASAPPSQHAFPVSSLVGTAAPLVLHPSGLSTVSEVVSPDFMHHVAI